MDLSIIIVNYNVKYFLEQCLHSVRKATKGINAEVFVVDNNSTDGSRLYLESRFPEVMFTWNTTNVGFGKANNSVLKNAKGRFILFLNPDTIIAEDTLQHCISFADKQHKLGGLGVRMIDGSGKYLRESKRSFPTASAAIYKMTGIHALFPRSKYFSSYYAGHLAADKDNKVDVLAGAFMMVSKEAIAATNGFDEDYFMYGEDIYLSYRMVLAGFENFYFGSATIIHFKGESTQRLSATYIQHFYGAMNLFVGKHLQGNKAKYMRWGIKAARIKAALSMFMQRKQTSKPVQASVAVLGTDKEFNRIIQVIKHAENPLIIKGRIALYPGDPGHSIGTVADIKKLARSGYFDHLVFCE
ncbi:MAG: glycosyltransferase family 2 protein, partial [Flavitalea sp.]